MKWQALSIYFNSHPTLLFGFFSSSCTPSPLKSKFILKVRLSPRLSLLWYGIFLKISLSIMWRTIKPTLRFMVRLVSCSFSFCGFIFRGLSIFMVLNSASYSMKKNTPRATTKLRTKSLLLQILKIESTPYGIKNQYGTLKS